MATLATPAYGSWRRQQGRRGRWRTVLIENSKLLAKLEGKDEVLTERNRVIDELRDDRTFLREELK